MHGTRKTPVWGSSRGLQVFYVIPGSGVIVHMYIVQKRKQINWTNHLVLGSRKTRRCLLLYCPILTETFGVGDPGGQSYGRPAAAADHQAPCHPPTAHAGGILVFIGMVVQQRCIYFTLSNDNGLLVGSSDLQPQVKMRRPCTDCISTSPPPAPLGGI